MFSFKCSSVKRKIFPSELYWSRSRGTFKYLKLILRQMLCYMSWLVSITQQLLIHQFVCLVFSSSSAVQTFDLPPCFPAEGKYAEIREPCVILLISEAHCSNKYIWRNENHYVVVGAAPGALFFLYFLSSSANSFICQPHSLIGSMSVLCFKEKEASDCDSMMK